MPGSSSRSTSWATTAVRHSRGSSGSRAAATATCSASRCTTACGRTIWTGASTRAEEPASGLGAGAGRLCTSRRRTRARSA
eukprot:10293949-Alexandrium_andersonii.AAC.1